MTFKDHHYGVGSRPFIALETELDPTNSQHETLVHAAFDILMTYPVIIPANARSFALCNIIAALWLVRLFTGYFKKHGLVFQIRRTMPSQYTRFTLAFNTDDKRCAFTVGGSVQFPISVGIGINNFEIIGPSVSNKLTHDDFYTLVLLDAKFNNHTDFLVVNQTDDRFDISASAKHILTKTLLEKGALSNPFTLAFLGGASRESMVGRRAFTGALRLVSRVSESRDAKDFLEDIRALAGAYFSDNGSVAENDEDDYDYFPGREVLADEEGNEHFVNDIGIDFASYEEYESYVESHDGSD